MQHRDVVKLKELKAEVRRLKECLPKDIDLHILEQHQTTLATLQKYLIVNKILTIDDLAVMTNGFLTNDHSDKVSEIAWNCMTFGQDEQGIISNVLEGDEPNSKIYYETPCSPGYKELREDSIKAQMERGRTREEAEVAYNEWKDLPNRGLTGGKLRELIAQKKEASV